MSRYTHQIIEVKINGTWNYVPVYTNPDDEHRVLAHCGYVRDMFGGGDFDTDKYLHQGVPLDISKQAREAMIYGDEDYVTCHPVWITTKEYSQLNEHLEQLLEQSLEKMFNSKEKSEIIKRLERLERTVSGNQTETTDDQPDDTYDDYDDYKEEYFDTLYAYVNACENLTEITTLVGYKYDDPEDIRIIMFTC